MNNNEIQQLAQKYLLDSENLHDYHAFSHDQDEIILGRVVFSWARSQGNDAVISRLLSMYIIDLAHQNYQTRV